MKSLTERLIVIFAILALAAMVGRLDERFIGKQDATYVSLRDAFNEWRKQ